MDTRLPYFDGQKDFMAFLRFLDNRKEYVGYIKQLDTKVAAFVKAAKLYGKAQEIEGKHEEAELWLQKAKAAFGTREATLLAGEDSLDKETRLRRAKMKNREVDVERALLAGTRDLKAREASLKAREGEVAKLEAVVAKAEQAAQKKSEAAVEAKRAADDMVARMKAAMPDG
jgi:uncharacterized protein involved in exopolysaccharide biosynthesis